jgi:hypothetical protein
MEAPGNLTRIGLNGNDLSADCKVSTSEANDDEAMCELGGQVDRGSGVKINHSCLPNHGSSLGVQGHHYIIKPAVNDHIRLFLLFLGRTLFVASVVVFARTTWNKRHAAIIYAAADKQFVQGGHFARDLRRLVSPFLLSGGCVQSEDVVVPVRDVKPAAHFDGRDFEFGFRVKHASVEDPGNAQLGGV